MSLSMIENEETLETETKTETETETKTKTKTKTKKGEANESESESEVEKEKEIEIELSTSSMETFFIWEILRIPYYSDPTTIPDLYLLFDDDNNKLQHAILRKSRNIPRYLDLSKAFVLHGDGGKEVFSQTSSDRSHNRGTILEMKANAQTREITDLKIRYVRVAEMIE